MSKPDFPIPKALRRRSARKPRCWQYIAPFHSFVGPADIFRNAQAIFCLFEKPQQKGTSPFDLRLTASGDDFAVMGMRLNRVCMSINRQERFKG